MARKTPEELGYYAVSFKGGTPKEGGLSGRELISIKAVLRAGVKGSMHDDSLWMEEGRVWNELRSASTSGVLLRRREKRRDRIAGFAYVGPGNDIGDTIRKVGDKEMSPLNMDAAATLQSRIAVVGWVVIHPRDQKRGGWGLIMDELDAQLQADPRYDSVVRVVKVRNGYADKVRRRYEAFGIEYEAPLIDLAVDKLYLRYRKGDASRQRLMRPLR
jgi:hypothetical protein